MAGKVPLVKKNADKNTESDKWAALLKWAPLLILILTAILYSKALSGKFSVFDDEYFILKNDLVKDVSLDGLKAIFTSISLGKYQPLTTLSYALEYRFFGFDPVKFHLTNIVLHLLSTWVVFKIAERLSSSRITAIVVSLLFGIHPMHVEEVAWAAERKDMLYAFFYLLAISVYLRYIQSDYKLKYYLATFLLFVASLLSKSEAITLPFVLIAIDIYQQRKMRAGMFVEKIPFVICSVIIAALSLMSQHADAGVGQVSLVFYGFVNRIFLFTTIPAFYVIKLIAPFGLSAMHYYPDVHGGLMPWLYYASMPFMLLLIWLLIKLPSFFKPEDQFLKRQLIFGISFFVITICVMPQLVSVGPALTPERYTYIPYLGFFFIIGQWLSRIGIPRWKSTAVAVFGVFVVLFCVLTWQRIDVWKDSDTLMTDMIEKNKDVADCSYLYWLRGNGRVEDENLPDAVQDYDEAIREHKGYVEAYSNRGAAHFQQGDVKSAIRDYDTSLRYSPSHAKSYYNRASGKATIGDFPGALADYDHFLKLSPNDKQAYMDRGMVRLTLKDSSGACEDWRKSASLGSEAAFDFIQHICK